MAEHIIKEYTENPYYGWKQIKAKAEIDDDEQKLQVLKAIEIGIKDLPVLVEAREAD